MYGMLEKKKERERARDKYNETDFVNGVVLLFNSVFFHALKQLRRKLPFLFPHNFRVSIR